MKTFLASLFLVISIFIQGQELPTSPENGFSFPIGSKFTIKLHPIDSTNYDYSVIAFEQFDKTVDTWDYDYLFDEEGQDSTITFYFCFGTHGKGKKEKEENMKVLLLMKNYSTIALKYSSDILRTENGDFESTSNIGTYPGALGQEIWPYMIYMIALSEFHKYEY